MNEMTKAEYLAIALQQWEELNALEEESDNFYDFEKGFEAIILKNSQALLEGCLDKGSIDRRKKKDNDEVWRGECP